MSKAAVARALIVEAQNKYRKNIDSEALPNSRKALQHDPIDHHMAEAIDNKNTMVRFAKQLERLSKTKDVQGFIQDIAPDMAKDLLLLAADPETNAKVKSEILKDLMDRAGFGKVVKHAVARFDAKDSKESIISTIMGSKKDLGKMGIEITDDEDNEEAT